jgi:hypothetical protein
MRHWPRNHYVTGVFGVVVAVLILLGMETASVLKTQRAVDAVRHLGGAACRSDECFDDGIPYGCLMPVNSPGWSTRCARAIGAESLFDVAHVDFRGDYKGSAVGDADLAVLAAFPDLLDLDLCDMGISDGGLKHVGQLTKLRNLDLRRTLVTDTGLGHLVNLKNLKNLNVDGTLVTRRGIERLKGSIPSLNTIPTVDKESADWDDLREEVDKFTKNRLGSDLNP